jgi:hypothetical protein
VTAGPQVIVIAMANQQGAEQEQGEQHATPDRGLGRLAPD